jgi:hypothetical protein
MRAMVSRDTQWRAAVEGSASEPRVRSATRGGVSSRQARAPTVGSVTGALCPHTRVGETIQVGGGLAPQSLGRCACPGVGRASTGSHGV